MKVSYKFCYTIATLIWIGVLYLVCSFINMEFNPIEWSVFGRLVFSILTFGLICFYHTDYQKEMKKNETKRD